MEDDGIDYLQEKLFEFFIGLDKDKFSYWSFLIILVRNYDFLRVEIK